MQLKVDGQTQTFIPLQTFRTQWGLPSDFKLATFEPKDWVVGSVEGAGSALGQMRASVLNTIEPQIAWTELPNLVDRVVQTFQAGMMKANEQIGLQPVEIEFAVAGFGDVLQAVLFELLRLRQIHGRRPRQILDAFDFSLIYQTWLDDATRVATMTHTYNYADREFIIRAVSNPYGRVGMVVEVEGERYYLQDMSLACSASGYMDTLCESVAHKICRAVTAEAPDQDAAPAAA